MNGPRRQASRDAFADIDGPARCPYPPRVIGLPSLVEMRAAQAKIAAWGPGARVFGLMWCQGCASNRPFVSSDAHTKHITMAECEACGFVYGTYDEPTINRGVVGPDGAVVHLIKPGRKAVHVISDEVAALAAAAWRSRLEPRSGDAPPPRPVPVMPDEGHGDEGSIVNSYKRNGAR